MSGKRSTLTCKGYRPSLSPIYPPVYRYHKTYIPITRSLNRGATVAMRTESWARSSALEERLFCNEEVESSNLSVSFALVAQLGQSVWLLIARVDQAARGSNPRDVLERESEVVTRS